MKKLTFHFLLIGTLVMIIVMAKTGAVLKTPEASMGILNLEFAYNTSKITPILFSWESINSVDIITQQKIIPIGIFIPIVLRTFFIVQLQKNS